MQCTIKIIALLFIITLGCACSTYAQDSPSLGDVARQTRQKKQHSKYSQNGTDSAKSEKVITNENLPEHSPSAESASSADDASTTNTAADLTSAKRSAEDWKTQILAQKSVISRLESNIKEVSDSIQFVGGNCVSGCVEWNQDQERKQHELERMRSQLEDQKAHLQQMQDAARQQGYGSSVYEP